MAKAVHERGLSLNPFAFWDLLEISWTLPTAQTTGSDGTSPLRTTSSTGFHRGVGWQDLAEYRKWGFGGVWRDSGALVGFGRNRLLTVLTTLGSRTLCHIKSFFPRSHAERDSDSAPICQPLVRFCRTIRRNERKHRLLKRLTYPGLMGNAQKIRSG